MAPRIYRPPWAGSGRERKNARSGQGTAELVLPGRALGKMQGDATGLAGDATSQGDEATPQGLGGCHWFTQPTPMRLVHRARLWAMTRIEYLREVCKGQNLSCV